MTWQTEDQFSLFDQDSWSGKMSPEHSVPTEEKTSKPSSKKSAASSAKKLPLFLFLKTDGRKADASAEWVTPAAPFPSLGDYTMHSFGESPNEENASRLSQILEDSPHPKYCLSARACEGILNRERAGRPGGAKESSCNMNTQEPCPLTKTKAFGISAYESNAMKSPNPLSGVYEAETSRTLDLNGGSPACNQGGGGNRDSG